MQLTRLLRMPWDDTMMAMEQLAAAPGRPTVRLAIVLLSTIACWYVYVPIHELLHALGCWATGGSVTLLEIQTQYGGALLARVFPFVVAGGEYAGRLSGFDTHGSDLVYLATDALPFALSALLGVPMLRACTRRARPWGMGVGVVLGLAPFYSLPGDYFEMGSILSTRLASWLGGAYEGLRSDDLFLLLDRLFTAPAELGLATQSLLLPLSIVALSLVCAVGLAYATWALGDQLAIAWIGESRRAGSAREEDERGDRGDGSADEHQDQQRVQEADPQ